MRDPLTDPRPGDIIQISPMWQRTVTKRTPSRVWFRTWSRVWFRTCFEGRPSLDMSSLSAWRETCNKPFVAVLRRAEEVENA